MPQGSVGRARWLTSVSWTKMVMYSQAAPPGHRGVCSFISRFTQSMSSEGEEGRPATCSDLLSGSSWRGSPSLCKLGMVAATQAAQDPLSEGLQEQEGPEAPLLFLGRLHCHWSDHRFPTEWPGLFMRQSPPRHTFLVMKRGVGTWFLLWDDIFQNFPDYSRTTSTLYSLP